MAVSTLEVLITGNTTGLTTALTKAAASTKAFAGGATKAGLGVQGALVGIGAAAAVAIAKGVAATQSWSAEVRTLQRVTGDSAENTSKLAAVGEVLNLSTQKLNTGFGVLGKNIVTNNKALTDYGITTHDAEGNTLPFLEILTNVQDKFQTLQPGVEQTGFAMRLFGRSGKEMIPILAKTSEQMQELFENAEKAGLVMSQDELDASKELSIAQHELGAAFRGASISIGKEFLPALTTATKFLTAAVDLFVAIPAPVKVAGFSIAVLTGLVAGLQLIGGFFVTTWGKVIGMFTGTGVSGGEAAAGIGAAGTAAGVSVPPTEALVAAVGELVLALQAETVAAGEASTALVGYGTTTSGLIVPTEALGAATTETELAIGSKSGTGLAGALGSLGPWAVLAVAAIGSVGFMLHALKRDSDAAHDAFQKGVETDLQKLSSPGLQRRTTLALVQQGRTTSNQGQLPTGAILAYNRAVDQATEAQAQWNEARQIAAQGQDQLTKGLEAAIAEADQASTPIADLGNAVALLNAGIDKGGAAMTHWSDITGVSTDSILDNLRTVVNDAKSTPEQVAAAYGDALAQMRAANQEWHDNLVAAFGGAGSALDKFADKHVVDIDKAIGSLHKYTADIRSFGTDIDTVQSRFGDRADEFVQWATSQGLAQQGLVHAVATASKEDANSFISSWKSAQSETDQLASAIQKALDPVFHKILGWLKNVVLAIQGVPVLEIKAETAAARHQIEGIHNALDLLPAEQRVDILVHTHAGSPWPDEALEAHLFAPLKKNGAKLVNGIWTVPLQVGVHTEHAAFNAAIGQAATSHTAEAVARNLKDLGKDITRTLLNAGVTKGEAQGVLDKLSERGLQTKFIAKSTHDVLQELGKTAAKAYHVHLRQLDRLTEIQHRQEVIAAHEESWIQQQITHNPQLPAGHTHINAREHTGPGHRRRDPVRLDRARFDEQLAYQRDYSGYNA